MPPSRTRILYTIGFKRFSEFLPFDGIKAYYNMLTKWTANRMAELVNEVAEATYMKKRNPEWNLDHMPTFLTMYTSPDYQYARSMYGVFMHDSQSTKVGQAPGVEWHRKIHSFGRVERGDVKCVASVTLRVRDNKYGRIYEMQDNGTPGSIGRYVPAIGKRLVHGREAVVSPSTYDAKAGTWVMSKNDKSQSIDARVRRIGWHSAKGLPEGAHPGYSDFTEDNESFLEIVTRTSGGTAGPQAGRRRRKPSPERMAGFRQQWERAGGRPQYGITPQNLTLSISSKIDDSGFVQQFVRTSINVFTSGAFENLRLSVFGKTFNDAVLRVFGSGRGVAGTGISLRGDFRELVRGGTL